MRFNFFCFGCLREHHITKSSQQQQGQQQQQQSSWDLVVHPVTKVIGEQALVDILDLSEVAWTCWGVSTPRSGLGLRMAKELDLQLALGMNERRKNWLPACV